MVDMHGSEEPLEIGFFSRSMESLQLDINTSQYQQILGDVDYRGETLWLYTYPNLLDDARWIRRELERIGIHIEIILIRIEDIHHTVITSEAHMSLIEMTVSHNREFSMMDILLSNGLVKNNMDETTRKFTNEKVIQAVGHPDEQKRSAVLLELEDEIIKQGWLCFLYNRRHRIINHPSVHNPLNYGWIRFRDVWIKPIHQRLIN